MKNLPHPRFLVFLAVFATSAFGLALLRRLSAPLALVIGFDVAVMVFLATVVPLLRSRGAAEAMRTRAARDDGGRVLLLLVAVAALGAVAVAVALLLAGRADPGPRDLVTLVGTLLLAWLFVNLIFAFHYAHLYHDQAGGRDLGGLEFPGGAAPVFSDFCYFSFVIGMTSQVSDVVITSSALRRVVTVHGMLAFAFNLGVMAMTINVLAGVL